MLLLHMLGQKLPPSEGNRKVQPENTRLLNHSIPYVTYNVRFADSYSCAVDNITPVREGSTRKQSDG